MSDKLNELKWMDFIMGFFGKQIRGKNMGVMEIDNPIPT